MFKQLTDLLTLQAFKGGRTKLTILASTVIYILYAQGYIHISEHDAHTIGLVLKALAAYFGLDHLDDLVAKLKAGAK